MADNFSEIVKLCRVEDENQVSRLRQKYLRHFDKNIWRNFDKNICNQVSRPTQAEEDGLEMQVRASNMVRAGESLMKLVSDLKIYLILNDFPNVNEAISSNSNMFKEMQVQVCLSNFLRINLRNNSFQSSCDRNLTSLRDDLATDLFELEEEYYSSSFK